MTAVGIGSAGVVDHRGAAGVMPAVGGGPEGGGPVPEGVIGAVGVGVGLITLVSLLARLIYRVIADKRVACGCRVGCAARGADELGMAVAAAAGVSITRATPPLLSHLAVSLSPVGFWNRCSSSCRCCAFWRSLLRRLAAVAALERLLLVLAGRLEYGVLGSIVRCCVCVGSSLWGQETCQLWPSHNGVASRLYI